MAIDANLDGSVFLIVSRGGNYVLRASRARMACSTSARPEQRRALPDGEPAKWGDLPQGCERAYANNEANFSVTAIDLQTNTVLTRDIPSSEPPAPGNFEHAVLVGKLAFFTALGIPDNDIFDIPIRDFVPLNFRGKQSKDAWSSCGSCHPDGLADGVTWFFGTGPRQTKPLDGMFAKDNPDDQGLLNWSAVRGSNTDFNANSRATQGGCGFASDDFDPGQCVAKGNTTICQPRYPRPRHHQGGSDALDAQTLWIFAAVRPLKQPQPSDAAILATGGPSLLPIVPLATVGPSGRRARSSTAITPPPTDRTGLPFDPGVTRSR